jgi:ribosomal protein S12 methylthiotransferase accessory factor
MDTTTAARPATPIAVARPRLKRHLHAEVSGDRVWLLSETGHRLLESPLLARLIPLIDGRRTTEEIADLARGTLDAIDVLHGLWQLEDGGYATLSADAAADEGEAAWRDLTGLPASDGGEGRRFARVVDLVGNGSAGVLAERLSTASFGDPVDDGFVIAVTADYLDPALDDVNRRALAASRPWLIVKPVGAIVWCGPLFVPGETACWECLARRLRERDVWTALGGGPGRPRLSRARLASAERMVLEMAVTETWRWAAGVPDRPLAGRLLTFDTRSLAWDAHVVVRQPTCAACGRQPSSVPAPPALRSRTKLESADGGYRCEPPDVVFERYRHHVSPITGIVDRVEPKRAADLDLVQIFTAPYTFARPLELANLPPAGGARLRSAGKGTTAAQARTGALCEGAERYAGIFRGDEVRTSARAVDLGDAAVLPNACMLFSDRQYAEREAWNRRALRFHWVPAPFDPERRIEWTAAWSLTEERFKYVPTAYCYYGYPARQEDAFCQADSNGSAAGGNLEEAILQGFLELVERDAVALWWYNRARRPRVSLESFEQPYFTRLERMYAGLNRDLAAIDITADFGIPTFAAVSFARGSDADVLLGFGAHLDPAIALSRALTELNQFLPAVIAGRKRDLFAGDDLDVGFLDGTTLPVRTRADFPRAWTPDLLDDVRTCVGLAQARGLETLMVDLTRPDVGIPVVKMIVPGLRPFWARFAAGRLYDVPPAIGWQDAPLRESDLNPSYILF